MALHICEVNLRGNELFGEWVLIVNDGQTAVNLRGFELSDYTRTQQKVHVLHFPPDTLKPGDKVYVFTEQGRNRWATANELHLYANRQAPVWNDNGDVAYLRNLDGTFEDTFTAGAPTRHPNGH